MLRKRRVPRWPVLCSCAVAAALVGGCNGVYDGLFGPQWYGWATDGGYRDLVGAQRVIDAVQRSQEGLQAYPDQPYIQETLPTYEPTYTPPPAPGYTAPPTPQPSPIIVPPSPPVYTPPPMPEPSPIYVPPPVPIYTPPPMPDLPSIHR